jgi:DHA1 family bicyclomycin/chloramphenicol resistance-like MFS transporter
MTLSSYFIGISGQLLYGPLLDRFGRKTIIYWIVGLYFVFGCAFVSDIDTLLVYVLYKR